MTTAPFMQDTGTSRSQFGRSLLSGSVKREIEQWASSLNRGILISARGGRRALLSEAVVTVHRAVAPGPEGHGGVFATFGANDRVHFPGVSIITVRRHFAGARLAWRQAGQRLGSFV